MYRTIDVDKRNRTIPGKRPGSKPLMEKETPTLQAKCTSRIASHVDRAGTSYCVVEPVRTQGRTIAEAIYYRLLCRTTLTVQFNSDQSLGRSLWTVQPDLVNQWLLWTVADDVRREVQLTAYAVKSGAPSQCTAVRCRAKVPNSAVVNSELSFPSVSQLCALRFRNVFSRKGRRNSPFWVSRSFAHRRWVGSGGDIVGSPPQHNRSYAGGEQSGAGRAPVPAGWQRQRPSKAPVPTW